MQRLAPAVTGQSPETINRVSCHSVIAYVGNRLPALVLAVIVMLILKRHYSLASADRLNWILAPTAKLVAWCTSANPLLESGVGYVDLAAGVIVAPACAGINFMIMAFGLAAFCGLHQIRRPACQLVWLILVLVAAYGLTLPVNTIRIALSVAMYQADIYTGWLTVERVHRLTGVVLYLGALWLLFLGLRLIIPCFCGRFDQRDHSRMIHLPGWLAVAWYLLGALGVPLVNGAWQRGAPSFGEHYATVLVASLALFAAALLVSRLLRAFRHNPSHCLLALYHRLKATCDKVRAKLDKPKKRAPANLS